MFLLSLQSSGKSAVAAKKSDSKKSAIYGTTCNVLEEYMNYTDQQVRYRPWSPVNPSLCSTHLRVPLSYLPQCANACDVTSMETQCNTYDLDTRYIKDPKTGKKVAVTYCLIKKCGPDHASDDPDRPDSGRK